MLTIFAQPQTWAGQKSSKSVKNVFRQRISDNFRAAPFFRPLLGGSDTKKRLLGRPSTATATDRVGGQSFPPNGFWAKPTIGKRTVLGASGTPPWNLPLKTFCREGGAPKHCIGVLKAAVSSRGPLVSGYLKGAWVQLSCPVRKAYRSSYRRAYCRLQVTN